MTNSEKSHGKNLLTIFDRFSEWVTQATGSPFAFIFALGVVIIWLVWGWMSDFSDNWEMVMDTGTMVLTLLMTFLIQQSQNKDTLALHMKLNELILANEKISNRLLAGEDMGIVELQEMKRTINEEITEAKEADKAKDKSAHE